MGRESKNMNSRVVIMCNNLMKFIMVVLIIFLQTCSAWQQDQCAPSACGHIQNISYPFCLNTHPTCCVNNHELACEGNKTTILILFDYVNNKKKTIYVQSINYENQTVRVVDPTLQIQDVHMCSPLALNHHDYDYIYASFYTNGSAAQSIFMLNCPFAMNSSNTLVEISGCSVKGHTYVKMGEMSASQVTDGCNVSLIGFTSWPINPNNISLSDFHQAMAYGFELYYFPARDPPLETLEHYAYRLLIDAAYRLLIDFPRKLFLHHNFLSKVPYGYLLTGLFTMYLEAKFVIGLPFVIVFLVLKFKRRHLSMFDVIEGFLRTQNNFMPIRYNYSNIKRMTRGFKQKLGEGGFGCVYKGKLRSGRDVAVKMLSKATSNGQDFMNEVATIGRIHHVNVVGLVGYCVDRSVQALVYDFMPNGSLDKYITNKEGCSRLSWQNKYEIILGVARGIEYLHRGCDVRILHFDIKPHNILLDENFIPKISDFGLAKLYPTDGNSMVTLTAARGTIGYVAPELINRSIGAVSYKADVYSFGMLLMEMLDLKRNIDRNEENSSQYFPNWIYHEFNKGKELVVDEEANDNEKEITRKMTLVALWCIQTNPLQRPSISKVMKMLEGEVGILEVPPQTLQSQPNPLFQQMQSSTTFESDSIALLENSGDNPIQSETCIA